MKITLRDILICLFCFIGVFILYLYLSSLYQEKLNNTPLSTEKIEYLNGVTHTSSWLECYHQDGNESRYLSNKLNQSNFINLKDYQIIISYVKQCNSQLKEKESLILKNMKQEDIIKLQKKTLNNSY